MNVERWNALMAHFGFPSNETIFEALAAAYSERHRRYHTARHIDDCIKQFDILRPQADNPAMIELALWFHDAVYNPYAHDNEEKSADWATQFLIDVGAPENLIALTRELILATRHDAAAANRDMAILIDVDLSILGSDSERYALFEQQVREEYRWIPGLLYRRERRKILKSFLDRNQIFMTREFFERYESSARNNLTVAIHTLG